MTESKSIFGKDLHPENIADYSGGDEYKNQGNKRTVKYLAFPFQVESPSQSIRGETILMEKELRRGDVVTVDELGPLALERGERIGAFYTDDELEGKVAVPGAPPAGVAQPNFDELGVDELAEYIEQKTPNVQDTVAMAGNDPEVAKRVLDAETQATNGDPRAGVVKGLSAIIGEGQ